MKLNRILAFSAAFLLFAGAASAGDYGRGGWYVGVGGGVAWDFLEDAVEDQAPDLIDIGNGATFNARAGYRASSWFALEMMYEGIYGLDASILGQEFSTTDLHLFMGGFKLIAPIKRFQPYIGFWFGGEYAIFDAVDSIGGTPLPIDLDTNQWAWVLRPAAGLDLYVTENWLVNAEIAPSVSVASFGEVPSRITDNVSLTLSAGIQYRF